MERGRARGATLRENKKRDVFEKLVLSLGQGGGGGVLLTICDMALPWPRGIMKFFRDLKWVQAAQHPQGTIIETHIVGSIEGTEEAARTTEQNETVRALRLPMISRNRDVHAKNGRTRSAPFRPLSTRFRHHSLVWPF